MRDVESSTRPGPRRERRVARSAASEASRPWGEGPAAIYSPREGGLEKSPLRDEAAIEAKMRPDWWALNKRALRIGVDAVSVL